MLQQNFLPESMYTIDSSMTYEKLCCFYKEGTTITGNVRRINSSLKVIDVDLGNGCFGSMSLEEATIYPLYKPDGTISPNLYHLVGKTIRATIIGFDSSNQLPLLSRKVHMLDAITFFKNETEFLDAYITGFSKHSAFFDIGAGIMGRSNTKAFATTKFRDVKDIGLHVGDIIPVKIISFSENESRFDVSRVAALPSVFDILSEGDVVTAQVFEQVKDEQEIGYYVQVDKKFNGIVDSPDVNLRYGDTITVFIKKIKDDGNLKVTLVKNC